MGEAEQIIGDMLNARDAFAECIYKGTNQDDRAFVFLAAGECNLKIALKGIEGTEEAPDKMWVACQDAAHLYNAVLRIIQKIPEYPQVDRRAISLAREFGEDLREAANKVARNTPRTHVAAGPIEKRWLMEAIQVLQSFTMTSRSFFKNSASAEC